MRPLTHALSDATIESREVLTSREGAKCERRLFPSEAFVRHFINSVVAPLPGRQLRLARSGGFSPWAGRFEDREEERRVAAAFDLVCSSFSATFGEREMDSGYMLARSSAVTEQIGGLNRRAVFAPVLRFLPLSTQNSYSIIDLDFTPGPSAPGLLQIYDERRRLAVKYPQPQDEPELVYMSHFGHEVIPIIARADPNHPLIAAFRVSLVAGSRVSLIAPLMQAYLPETSLTRNSRGGAREEVPRSFCFPINFGIADGIDCRASIWFTAVETAELQGVDLESQVPFFGFPAQVRDSFLRLAEDFDTLAETVDGRPVRRAITTGLFFILAFVIFGPAAALAVAGFSLLTNAVRNEIEDAARHFASALRQAAVTNTIGELARRNTTAATALAIMVHAMRMAPAISDIPFAEFAIRLRPRSTIVDALSVWFNNPDPYPPSGGTPFIKESPGLPSNRLHGPIIHIAPRYLRYPFQFYEELDQSSGLNAFSRALSPTLQFRDTLNLAMELYQQAIISENAWLAVAPVAQSQGALAVTLKMETGLVERQLVALRTLFGPVSQARVIAFIWRQLVVDNFIAEHRAFVDRVASRFSIEDGIGKGIELTENVTCDPSVLFNTFCWMRRVQDRQVLDRVLGPTVQQDGVPRLTRDLKNGLFGQIFHAGIWDIDEAPLLTALQRFEQLPCVDRCDIWPRFLEIVADDSLCRSYEGSPTQDGRFHPRPGLPDDRDREPDLDGRPWEVAKPGWRRESGAPGNARFARFDPLPGPGWAPLESPNMVAGASPTWHCL